MRPPPLLRMRPFGEIVLATIFGRTSKPNDLMHDAERGLSGGPHLVGCEQPLAALELSLVELGVQRLPAQSDAVPVNHADGSRFTYC